MQSLTTSICADSGRELDDEHARRPGPKKHPQRCNFGSTAVQSLQMRLANPGAIGAVNTDRS